MKLFLLERLRLHRVRPSGRSVPAGMPRPFPSPRRFLRDVRGGATAIVAAAVTVMTLGGTALIGDHLWLVDQRDTLKSAADSASIAATLEIDRQLSDDPSVSDADLKTTLDSVAKRYVLLNLAHLSAERLKQAKDTLTVTLDIDREERAVGVAASADLGGTLFSRSLPLLGSYKGPEASVAKSGVESNPSPVEVVLAIDISGSMTRDLKGKFNGPADEKRIAIVKKAAKHLVDIVVPDEEDRIAIGLVPWHHHVRLDATTTQTWTDNSWARYPTRRRYEVPYINCDTYIKEPEKCTNPPAAVEQALPATAPETWQGCLSEERLEAGATLAGLPKVAKLLDLPADGAFAQSFFPAVGEGIAYHCLDHKSTDWPADFEAQRCFNPPPHGECGMPSHIHEGLRSVFGCGFFQQPISDPQYECAASPTVLPLSTDPDTVRSAIKSLDAVGIYTHSALGVLWSHRLLLPSWKKALGTAAATHPVDSGEGGADKVRKAVVLLTDGEDTQCGFGNSDCDQSSLGIAREDACTAAKKAGIEIFVVTAMHEDKVSTDLKGGLRACSSTDDTAYPEGTKRPSTEYLFVNNNDEAILKASFAKIAKQLRTVRRIN